MGKGMTISRAAEQAGVGIETIRFYERRGLIERPLRPRSGGYRVYEGAVVERIRFIRQAQDLGFSLREILELLSLRADPATDCSDIRAQAMTKRREVDRRIAKLQQMRSALDQLIGTCPGGGALRACTIIDALAGPGRGEAESSEPASACPSNQLERRGRTAKGSRMKTALFKIGGMHCDGCARTIAAVVSAEPGVQKATVSFNAQEARIMFDPQATDEERLVVAVQKAGYAVVGRPS
ncbi:MerR family transcriptional regulator [Bradyrhizobium centrolobii]|uniref:Mercuric resistance operon regulatory protein n=1 Tax=Bradyrhizobium centrolobii TaxID=1505087 RepID=A0A176Z088_9BRAD|nr:MerR family DNA-binding protein [Bradyrhizobium centrolobii]OAF12437.1 MerR family transcriptional regulator [Bradyrhizobium centrolobii]